MVSFKLATAFLYGSFGNVHAESIRASALMHRKLSFQSIAGYEPKSLVTDHNAIDLDQAELEKQLAFGTSESHEKAKSIYVNGAFSKAVAQVTLTTALTGPINESTAVSGKAVDGETEIVGKLVNNYPTGTTVIEVQYQTISIQSSYVGCQVGANPNPFTEGCFAESGELVIDGEGTFEYTYSALENNLNQRTLQGFSTGAEASMYRCEHCPYVTYEKFNEYYGSFDYADAWVMAAFDGRATDFANGNADFSKYGYEGRTEAIQKGTAYMNVWMYVIREMEDAIDDCQEGCDIENCNDDPVHAWDEAVAFYTGSLEGVDGKGAGVLIHQLADKRCANFKTCGDLATETSGVSHVNLEIFRQFKDGQRKLTQGQCSSARENKEKIEQLMAVPLVQGTIRYAHITNFETDAGEKAEAEGAVFAASVLPLVHACDEDSAETIYQSMKTGQNGSADFVAVKKAFEKVYSCMGIRCEDVGGLYDPVAGGYLQHASPCGVSSTGSSDDGGSKKTGLAIALSFGGLALLGAIVFFTSRSNRTQAGAGTGVKEDEANFS